MRHLSMEGGMRENDSFRLIRPQDAAVAVLFVFVMGVVFL